MCEAPFYYHTEQLLRLCVLSLYDICSIGCLGWLHFYMQLPVSIISFSLTFIGVVVAARLLGSVVERIVNIALLGWLNRLLGVVFAVIKMTLITSVTLFIINSIDKELSFMPREQVQRSKFYMPVSGIAPTALTFLDFDKVKKLAKELDEKVDNEVESWK